MSEKMWATSSGDVEVLTDNQKKNEEKPKSLKPQITIKQVNSQIYTKINQIAYMENKMYSFAAVYIMSLINRKHQTISLLVNYKCS